MSSTNLLNSLMVFQPSYDFHVKYVIIFRLNFLLGEFRIGTIIDLANDVFKGSI